MTIPNVNGIGTQDYLVASQQSGTQLTLTDQTTDADCTNVIYTLTWTGDFYGVPPLGCPLCCTYRGRLVLAGPGIVWYMSRVLDPTDFDFGYDPNDPSRAVGGTSTTTGGIPEPIVALIPHSDDYLIFGCERSLWLLTGDPAYGGTISALSRDIGVLGPGAWCTLPDSSVVILSRDGLYLIPAGAGSPPQPISRPLLPAELVDLDWQANVISMCYDVEGRGIHLSPLRSMPAGRGYAILPGLDDAAVLAGQVWERGVPSNGHDPLRGKRFCPSGRDLRVFRRVPQTVFRHGYGRSTHDRQ